VSLEAGRKLAHYEILDPIGKGGMGEVYRARDTKLDRDVAIKVLPEEFAQDEERVARFEREAKLLASLNHPNIAGIHGFESNAIVLELVEGPTLAERIAQGQIPVDETVAIAKQIAEALEAGHEAGIIHRDLKPANIKVKEDGSVKVLDYGLAKAFEDDSSGDADSELSQSPTLTRQGTQIGVILGTAAYMSPEQAKGKNVDKRSDVWSFGVVVYEMLTARKAFAGDDIADTLAAVLRAEPDWDALPAALPPVIRTFLMRCLERDPKRRVRDIGDLRLALEGAYDTTPGSFEPASRPAPWLAWGIAGVAAFIAIGALWNDRRPAPRAVTRFSYELPVDQVLQGNARQPSLAVSPDGRHFVYNTTRGIYLRSMDELEARALPTESQLSLGIATVFLSPDGQSVAYQENGQLKRLSLSGGAPIVICSIPSGYLLGATWAADDTIFFAGPEGVSHVSAQGGTPELVVANTEGDVVDAPELLPDGGTLLVTVRHLGDSRIETVSLATGERKTLVEAGSDAHYVVSGHLLYAAEGSLFAVAFDTKTHLVTSAAVSMVQGLVRTGRSRFTNYAVSDDGTLFYLADRGLRADGLAWVDRTGEVEVIETIPADEYFFPRLSPDGERVLVTAHGDARIYELANGRESRLTTDGSTNYLGWTPDGDAVAYTSTRGAVEGEIWLQPADGSGEARQLTSLGGRVDFDDWAPDGRTFTAHHHLGTTTNVLMVAFDGEKATPVTWFERDYVDDTAVFSPDGRFVAFLSGQTGEREVYIRPFPGPGGQTTVSVGGGIEPVWAANGELFYRRPSDYMLMAVQVRTEPTLMVGTPAEVFAGPSRGGNASPTARYSVTADGQRFLMSRGVTPLGGGDSSGQGSRIVIVQNWVEELKARVPN